MSENVYASDPDAFTEAWCQRRARAYANDARKIVDEIREYEDVHPADAPCLEPLLRAVPVVAWRGHDRTHASGTS